MRMPFKTRLAIWILIGLPILAVILYVFGI